ncbi:33 kDa chaperonin [Clostridia bacterium]|nr:33 kDa chaperonin [Clostridia bacterium]
MAQNNNLYRAISFDGSTVVSVLDATEMVQKIEQIHKPSAVVTAALGRLSIASSLMGYNLKGKDESITLQINGGGQTGTLLAVSDSSGNVKCYAHNYIVELPMNSHGKLDVAGAVGTDGTLTVIKDLRLKEPYVSQVPLVSGEIAEDIASYFVVSEQTPTVCALGVLVAPDLSVICAGGYLLSLLPFASEDVVSTIEKNIQNILPVTGLLEKGFSPEKIANILLDGMNAEQLDTAIVEYKCNCSRERTEQILIALGKEELQTLAKEQPITEVACHFCNNVYKFTSDDVLQLAINNGQWTVNN